uniref:L-Fucosyltransferase n=1 Tax=Monodon monoceros TaxID=40151 RepID=A0A8C6AML8_MONMO
MSGVAGTKGGERETGQGQMLGRLQGPAVQSRGWQDRGWTRRGNGPPPHPGLQPLMRSPLGSGGLGALLGPTVQAPGSESGPGLISQPAAFPPQSPALVPGICPRSPAPALLRGSPHLPPPLLPGRFTGFRFLAPSTPGNRLSPTVFLGKSRRHRLPLGSPDVRPPVPAPLETAATLSPQGPRAATPPGAVWDMSAVAPQGPTAGQPRAGWPRGLKAGSGSAPARGGCDLEGAGLLGSAALSGPLTLRRDVGLWLCDPKPAPPALWNLVSCGSTEHEATMRFWATCPSLSTIYFLFVTFAGSTIFHCLQRLARVPAPWTPALGGMSTINSKGRLGNQMGEYALAKMNGRPAFIPPQMHSTLAPIFRITLPVLHDTTASRIPWQNYPLNDWMEERYRHIPGEYVRLTGYPCSWTFYHHLRAEILQEFTLHDHVREEAQNFLRGLQVNGSRPSTYVGVHVCRGDYVHVMPNVWKGVVADRGYLQQALDWFRARYRSPLFVVTSDDMAWCRQNVNSSLRDVVFADNGLQGSPARDFALLAQRNHTIITVGTFGIWATCLTVGNTIYLPNSPFHVVFKHQVAFLLKWVGTAANPGQARENGP